jgi:hypothetical protein
MNNWNQILTTAFLTATTCVFIFCIGQITLKFLIEVPEWIGKRIKKVAAHGCFA